MRKIAGYDIVTAKSATELVIAVRAKMENAWHPKGTATYSQLPDGSHIWYQTVFQYYVNSKPSYS